MKKIYLVLLVTLILGFVAGNKANGQPGCENCVAPWSCTTFTLTINCNGVEFPVEYTVCYFCSPTAPIVDAQITRIDGIPIGTNCYWIAKEAGERWILENGIELCGVLPCEVSVKTFRIYEPICADEIKNPNTNTFIVLLNNSCDWRCVSVWEWCWCSCDQNCDRPCCRRPNVIGCVHYQLLNRYRESNQECPEFQESENITRCKRFEIECDN